MPPNDRYYKKDEIDTIKYYQLPKVLFTNPKYLNVSLGAKVLYSVIRDRQDLSIKNDWVDENNNVYSVYQIETRDYENPGLAELLNINRTTVIAYKKELVACELLEDRRNGQNKPNWLYVFKPETVWTPETDDNSGSRKSRHPGQERKLEIPTSAKNKEVGNPDIRAAVWKSENPTREVGKSDPNELIISETEYLNEWMKGSPEHEIFASIQTHQSWLYINSYQTLTDRPELLLSFHNMLLKQFPRQLHPDIADHACWLYREQTYDTEKEELKFLPLNPVGFFHTCYKDAIVVWKAKTKRGNDR